MIKVYMLNPPYIPHFGRAMRWQDTGKAGTLYYPVWLSYATGVVEEEYETRLVDAPAWNWDKERVIEDIGKFEPDLIVMDSSFPSLDNDIMIAAEIKKNAPDVVITLVGPPCSQFPEKILRSQGVDIVARWEYDFTVKEIAGALDKKRALEEIKGISYKDGGRIVHNSSREFTSSEDLDKIPFVSKIYKRHLNVRDYFLGNSLYPEVQIFTGRGCPFPCTFCSWPQTFMGREYRVRSISNILDEMAWVQQNLPQVKEVFFEDDTFAIDKRIAISLADQYMERGLSIAWACNARVGLGYDTMKRMKEANCRLLIVGYESGSNAILKSIKKGITVEETRQFAQDARRAGLLINGDFIIGLPGETKETVEQTRRLIDEIKPDILQVSVASPFPGTEFYEWARSNGYLITDDPNEYLDEQGHQKAIISYPGLPAAEMVKTVDEMLKGYYLSPKFVPIALRQIFRKHGWDELKRVSRLSSHFLKYVSSRNGGTR